MNSKKPPFPGSPKPLFLSSLKNLFRQGEIWLAAAVLAVFANTLRNGFVFDDEHFIVKNIFLTHWKFLPRLLTENMVAGMGMTSNLYRPLQALTHFLDVRIWGYQAWGHHLTNVLLHLAASLLVFRYFRRLFATGLALFLAALTVLHPIQSEIVAYLSGRGDTLALIFLMAGLLAFPKRRLLALGCHLLALGSKESLMLFPVFLLLSEGVQRRKIRWIDQAPFWGLSAGYFLLRLTVLNFKNTLNFYAETNLFTEHLSYRFFTYLTALAKGMMLWIAPYDLHHERNWPVSTSFWLTPVWTSALLLIFLGVLAFFLFRKKGNRLFAAGLLWFLAGTFPTSNLVVLINALFYDHWFMIPGIGLVLALGSLLGGIRFSRNGSPLEDRPLPSTRLERAALICGLFIVAAYAGVTIQANGWYRDTLTLNRHILDWEPQSAKAASNYAMALSERGKTEEAIVWFQKSIALSDEYPQTHHNLGIAYRDLGRYEEARGEFDKALAMQPDFYHSWIQKGVLEAREGRLAEAEASFQKAVEIYAYDPSGYAGAAQVRALRGDREGALAVLRQGLERLPGNESLREVEKILRGGDQGLS